MIINHDPVMTLTYFRPRSTCVAYAFEWGKLYKCHFQGKLAGNWQMDRILYACPSADECTNYLVICFKSLKTSVEYNRELFDTKSFISLPHTLVSR